MQFGYSVNGYGLGDLMKYVSGGDGHADSLAGGGVWGDLYVRAGDSRGDCGA